MFPPCSLASFHVTIPGIEAHGVRASNPMRRDRPASRQAEMHRSVSLRSSGAAKV